MHLLETHGIRASMSGVGQCGDNAAMEGFWATPETELVHPERYETRGQARAAISEYIEVFYDRKRPHSSLALQRYSRLSADGCRDRVAAAFRRWW